MSVEQLAKEWEWFSFLVRYCAGANIDHAICRDFMWWAIGAAALVAALFLWWIVGRISSAYRSWAHERALARVADEETMKKHVWSGYSPDARPGSEQRADKTRGSAGP